MLRLKRFTLFDYSLIAFPVLIWFTSIYLSHHLPPLRDSPFLISLYAFIGMFLAGVIDFFYSLYTCFKKKRGKREKSAYRPSVSHHLVLESTIMMFSKVEKLPEYTKKVLTYLSIVIMAFANIAIIYLYGMVNFAVGQSKTNNLFYALFEVSTMVVSSKLILKINLHVHHYVSLAFIAIGIIGLHLYTTSFDIFEGTVPYYLGVALIYSFIYPMFKLVMEMKYIQPTAFCFYYGLVGIGMIWLIYLVFYIWQADFSLAQDVLNIAGSIKASFETVLLSFLTIVHVTGVALTFAESLMIIYYRDPVYEVLFRNLYQVPKWIHYTIIFTLPAVPYVVISAIGSAVIWFGALVYVELIILYCCGMEVHTETEIILRAKQEVDDVANLSLIEMEGNNIVNLV